MTETIDEGAVTREDVERIVDERLKKQLREMIRRQHRSNLL